MLTQICLAQTLIYTSDTLILIKKLERNETSRAQRELFSDCDEGYGFLLTQFEDASFAFRRGDYKSMLGDIDGTEGYVVDCETSLGNKLTELHKSNIVTKVLIQMSNASGKLIGSHLWLSKKMNCYTFGDNVFNLCICIIDMLLG